MIRFDTFFSFAFIVHFYFLKTKMKSVLILFHFPFYQSLSVQERLYKSLKVWLLYADLEEALGTFKVINL